jgi:hypothetical protein
MAGEQLLSALTKLQSLLAPPAAASAAAAEPQSAAAAAAGLAAGEPAPLSAASRAALASRWLALSDGGAAELALPALRAQYRDILFRAQAAASAAAAAAAAAAAGADADDDGRAAAAAAASSLAASALPLSVFDAIERDVPRTCFFGGPRADGALRRLLAAYAIFDADIACVLRASRRLQTPAPAPAACDASACRPPLSRHRYVQSMNFLAAFALTHAAREDEAW